MSTTEKTAKLFGKLTAKTISATTSITGKTVDAIKVTPSKTSNLTKSITGAIAEGYREVRPADVEDTVNPDTPQPNTAV